MFKYAKFFVFFAFISLFCACSSVHVRPNNTGTQIDLSRNNYKIIKSNVTGSSVGFKLLGILPIVSPSYTNAMTDLHRTVGASRGTSQALVNFAQEDTSTYLLIFSIPKIKVRADVIEFIDDPSIYKQSSWH